ncbi:hypothetical protein Tco_1327083 [Tanacetum coccineum]
MESFRRNFFNGMDRSENKMVWIRWEKLLASKKNGGLGISSFFATNRALPFKWMWQFITQCSSLWSNFIKAIHGDKGAIDNPNSSSRTSIWLDLICEFSSLTHKGIDLIALVKRKLGNGENTLFWEDIWLGDSSLKTKFPRLFALELCKDISVAEKMAHSSLILSFRRLPRGGAEDVQYRDLCSHIYEVLLPNMSDRWAWTLNASGDFLVSSTRSYIDDGFLSKSDVPTRWVKMVPIKVNILVWKINLDGLPTRLNLSSRESVVGGISSSPPGTPIPIGLVGFLAFVYLKPKRRFLKAFAM